MNQAGLVRVGEATTHLFDEVQLPGKGEGCPPPNQLVQRLARDVLHGDVRAAVLVADVVNGDDVGVAQASRRPGLSRESVAGVLVLEIRAKHLDGDEPVNGGIEGQIEDTHAALADAVSNLIPTDLTREVDGHVAERLALY